MKKRVLIAEQHIRRGVDANALIAAYLEEMGIETRLTMTGSQLFSHIVRFKPHVVYYPWVAPPVLKFMQRRAPAVPIVNAFQEQNTVLHQSNAPMVQWSRESDYIFAWGEAHKRRFEKLFSKPEVVLTGNPRLDAYFESDVARALYPSRSELAKQYELPSSKEWILFALDFPLLFQNEDRIQELVGRGDLKKGQLRLSREIYFTIKDWMRKFVASAPDSTVLIVRPHPGSDLKQIKHDFGGETDSVRFIRGGGMPPWILAADRYVSRASTSVVEAWLADVPTALIQKNRPIEAGLARPHLTEAQANLSSYTEFRRFIAGTERKSSRRQHHEFLSDHYCLDGRSSFRTARHLCEIAERQPDDPDYSGRRIEDIVEHGKFFLKKVINESGANRWNPFDRPNDEFLSQRKARQRVSKIKRSI
jgi:surface carbohydrate biosynthesis protein